MSQFSDMASILLRAARIAAPRCSRTLAQEAAVDGKFTLTFTAPHQVGGLCARLRLITRPCTPPSPWLRSTSRRLRATSVGIQHLSSFILRYFAQPRACHRHSETWCVFMSMSPLISTGVVSVFESADAAKKFFGEYSLI